MLLDEYLEHSDVQVDEVLRRVKLKRDDVAAWTVIEYPDELIYRLSKETRKEPSLLLYELLELENPGQIRRTVTDYSLFKALESEVIYVFIPIGFRREQTKFLTDVMIEKNVFELDFHPLARYNFLGREIYKVFLESGEKSTDFERIEDNLTRYFVLIHDKSGTILCHSNFIKKKKA